MCPNKEHMFLMPNHKNNEDYNENSSLSHSVRPFSGEWNQEGGELISQNFDKLKFW